MSALVIGAAEIAAIETLRVRAESSPIPVEDIIALTRHEEGRARHRARMSTLSIGLPIGFIATYSLEQGHPCGDVRHLSVSIDVPERCPSPAAVWMIAEHFGFVRGLEACLVWTERFDRRGLAVNVVQQVDMPPAAAPTLH